MRVLTKEEAREELLRRLSARKALGEGYLVQRSREEAWPLRGRPAPEELQRALRAALQAHLAIEAHY